MGCCIPRDEKSSSKNDNNDFTEVIDKEEDYLKLELEKGKNNFN